MSRCPQCANPLYRPDDPEIVGECVWCGTVIYTLRTFDAITLPPARIGRPITSGKGVGRRQQQRQRRAAREAAE